MESIGLQTIDFVIIIVYLVGIVVYGIRKGKQQSSEDYFLAGRNMTWPIVGISLFAANIGSNTLIGLTSDAYQQNVAMPSSQSGRCCACDWIGMSARHSTRQVLETLL